MMALDYIPKIITSMKKILNNNRMTMISSNMKRNPIIFAFSIYFFPNSIMKINKGRWKYSDALQTRFGVTDYWALQIWKRSKESPQTIIDNTFSLILNLFINRCLKHLIADNHIRPIDQYHFHSQRIIHQYHQVGTYFL